MEELKLNDRQNRNLITSIARRVVPDYRFDEPVRKAAREILDWFNSDSRKGILLMGNIGSGKTRLMQIFEIYSRALESPKLFEIINVLELQEKFVKQGWQGIESYSRNTVRTAYDTEEIFPKSICIDDLGVETNQVNHYGNSVNVIEELLFTRYELWFYSGIVTHATTNLNSKMLQEKYGQRLGSRFKDMFRIVVLSGADRRG